MSRAPISSSAIVALLLAAASASNDFGIKFLEENKQRAGVVALPSGLQYKVLAEGDGEAHPQAGTSCSCHYEGRTAQEWSKQPSGKTFDSSYARGEPTSFAPNQARRAARGVVERGPRPPRAARALPAPGPCSSGSRPPPAAQVIAGWTEAMQLMVEGDKWEMYIPSELGYGDSGQGADIGPGDVLVFTMEILKINGASVPAERGPPGFDELATTEQFAAWAGAARGGGGALVLGLFRRPTVGDLFATFKSAARALAKEGAPPAVALWAQARYDAKAKKYTVSELETQLGFKPPALLVSADQGATWTKCAVSGNAEKRKAAVVSCARAAAGGGEL